MVSADVVGMWIFPIFLATQIIYFLIGTVTIILIFGKKNIVSPTPSKRDRRISVLLPVHNERKEIIQETVDSIRASDYPEDLVEIFVIYEENDATVNDYIDELAVRTITVDLNHEIWEHISEIWKGPTPLPPNKARALTYALYTHQFYDVITVLDADTVIPPDLFGQAIAGLEQYDVVQAKQTVRNIEDGWLPKLEAMGMAAWCDQVYAPTSVGPYQLLGKAYFINADTLYSLEGWNPYDITEDMALGLSAFSRGLDLGVIDLYIQDLCPVRYRDWVRQKKRWVSGPYRALRDYDLTPVETLKFATYTLGMQVLSLVNVVGVPVGVTMFLLYILGYRYPEAAVYTPIFLVNLLYWVNYTWHGLRAWQRSSPGETGLGAWRFYLVSNMLTQPIYVALWAIPISLAIKDFVLGRETSFAVTPK